MDKVELSPMESAKLKTRVVIVDDDEDIVNSFINQFSDEFDVTAIHWTRDTTWEIEGTHFDDGVAVAVVDERMPYISGIEVLSRLQAEKPEIKRILLTGYADFSKLAT